MNQPPRISKRTELCNTPYFRVVEDLLELSGRDDYRYYSIDASFDVAVIIPVFDDGSLLLEHIYRHPLGTWVHEFPAGGIEPGEDACACAARELTEETGCRADELIVIGSQMVMPGLLLMQETFVLARGLDMCGGTEHEPLELIETERVDLQRAWMHAETGPGSSFLTQGLLWYEHWLQRADQTGG